MCAVLGAALQEGCGQYGKGRRGRPLTSSGGSKADPTNGRLQDLNLFSLHKRRLRGDLVAIYELGKGDQQAMGESLFPPSATGKTRNNGHKLTESRFRLDIRRHYFSVRAARSWNQFPRDVVLACTLRVFKRKLDSHLDGVI